VSNITTLIFKGQSIILRPSKIFAIRVKDSLIELPDDLEDAKQVEVAHLKVEPKKEDPPVIEEDEDVITD